MNFSPRFVKLSEVTTLRNGAGIKQENFTDESNGIPLVKVSNFTQNSIDMSDLTMVNFDHAQKWKSHVIQRGNVLIATVGSWPPNWSSVVGKVVRAPQNAEGSIQNQNTCCLIPTEELHEGYLYYKLKDPKFLEWVVNIAQGSANQARVPVKKLGEYQFELPPMEVQKSIADALESLDLKISANSHINQTLEQMAQAIFKSWFVDFDPVKAKMNGEQPEGMDEATASLFPDKLVESELGLIPDGWKVTALADLFSLQGGISYKSKLISDDGVPMITMGAISPKERFNFKGVKYYSGEFKPQHELNRGDIVVSTRDVTQARVTLGAPAIIPPMPNYEKVILATNMYKLDFINETMPKLVMFEFLRTQEYRNQIIASAKGTTVLMLTKDALLKYKIAMPSSELLEKANALLKSFYEQIEQSVQENFQLQAIRDTLLPKLLSGEIELVEQS